MEHKDRLRQVQNKLQELDARMQSQVDGPNGSRLSFHSVRGVVVMLQVNRDASFEIYAPVSLSARIDDTFLALDTLLESHSSKPISRESTEFDLEYALAGARLVTRGGQRVFSFRHNPSINRTHPFTFLADIDTSDGLASNPTTQAISYTERGQFSLACPSPLDLLMADA